MKDSKVDFFFVGFPKCGSTTFWHLLRAHPEIFSPEVKEFNFFCTDHKREMERRLGKNYFDLTPSEKDYSIFFSAGQGKIKGDFSPYTIFSDDAPKNIYQYNPDAKIIISIREPVAFLRSFHFQSLYNMSETEPDFLKALSLEESRRDGYNIPQYCVYPFHLFYSELVKYKKYIERYIMAFGLEKVKIILFDDILQNENMVYRDILYFLAVKNLDVVPPKPDRNPSHTLRFVRFREMVLSPPVKKWLYSNTPQRLLPIAANISQMIFKKTQDKPFVSKDDIEQLKAHFKPDVIELSAFLKETNLVDCDLETLWKY